MGRLNRLNIITTDPSLAAEDHGAAVNQGTYTSQTEISLSRSKNFQPTNNQVVNEYERVRQFTIQENQKRLEDLGIKNKVNSITSLAQSEKMKKKTAKKNTREGENVDYEKRHPKFISPMSTNRVANLRKLRRVMASNVPEKVASTKIVTKPSTSEGGAKRMMTLVDEDDFEDDEIFDGGNIVEQDQSDMQMAECEHVREELQAFEKETTTDTLMVENEQALVNAETMMEDAGAPKKVRGYTQKAEIWQMGSTERICVEFDRFGQPIGDEGRELGQYLGTLVRMGENVSIEYSDWRKVPLQKKEDMYTLVKSKFKFHPVETSQIKAWILFSMGKKWRTWKCLLKSRAYDPSLSIDEIVTQQTNNDERLKPDQFKELVTRWFTSDFQNTCAKKRASRSKMREPHVTGTKSFARLAHEMAKNNDGRYPTRKEMYIKTRTRKDGSLVDAEAVRVVNSLIAIASDSTSPPEDQNDIANDDYSKVKGQEKRGYVRLVGRMPATKSKGDSKTIQQLENATQQLENATQQLENANQTINQLQSNFNAMMNIIREHIPNANLSALLSNMNTQVSRIGSSNDESSKNAEHDGERVDGM